jgi:O-antigen/teichoic acid export membrane protein
MSLARRSITSVGWNAIATLTRVAVFFVRSILLARMLPVETFGVYAFAGSVAALTVELTRFGMGGAFLHRSPETEHEQRAATVHFTLKLLFTGLWACLMVAGALMFTSGELRTALLLLTATTGGVQLAQTPRLILTRRVVHRRLALLQLANALLTTIAALTLAWRGATLWALLATDVVTLALTLLFLYLWRPVWRPRLAWSAQTVRYYLRFGSRNFLAGLLLRALDRVDDLWTGFHLGQTALGYYSRAYQFATYPRAVLAMPVSMVAGGTYAELKGDRRRLSKAFYRVNALLVRSGFLMAGLLALIAPEFIRLALGAKWLPMLDAFRLMLIFTLLDPIKATVGSLFVAVGRPELLVRARLVQLVVLVAGLYSLGLKWGIAGVALAVDVMLVVGIAILLWQARAFVKFSAWRLFAVPSLALIAGIAVALGAVSLSGVSGSDWQTGFIKAGVFAVVYGLILAGLERRQLVEAFAFVLSRMTGNDAQAHRADPRTLDRSELEDIDS